jgi:plastocyanin
MIRTLALVFMLAVAGALAGCGGDDDDTAADETTVEAGGGAVTGTVGPGFDISMAGTDGLEPGPVTIVVTDNAATHNFHLTGPGVDEATDVGGEGEETFEVTLEAGEYTFVCDPHSSQMKGSFTVE